MYPLLFWWEFCLVYMHTPYSGGLIALGHYQPCTTLASFHIIPYHSWPSKTILSCADARTYLSAIIAFNQMFWFPVNDCRRFRYKTYKTLCLHWDTGKQEGYNIISFLIGTWIFLRCLIHYDDTSWNPNQ